MSDIGWIRLNVEVPHHAKFVRLANELGVREAWPRVVQLWCWAANSCRNGDLTGMKDTQIAAQSGWKGGANRFVTAMRSCGFIDPDNRIHDWDDEQGKMLESREKDKIRKREDRAKKAALSAGQSAPASTDASRAGARGRADETRRDETEVQEKEPSPADAGATSEPSKAALKAKPAKPDPVPDEPEKTQYLTRYRALFRSPSADFAGFAGVRLWRELRKRHGHATLMDALDGLKANEWEAARMTLQRACSQAGVELGLKPPPPRAGPRQHDATTGSVRDESRPELRVAPPYVPPTPEERAASEKARIEAGAKVRAAFAAIDERSRT